MKIIAGLTFGLLGFLGGFLLITEWFEPSYFESSLAVIVGTLCGTKCLIYGIKR